MRAGFEDLLGIVGSRADMTWRQGQRRHRIAGEVERVMGPWFDVNNHEVACVTMASGHQYEIPLDEPSLKVERV